jgi:hypothetical protein
VRFAEGLCRSERCDKTSDCEKTTDGGLEPVYADKAKEQCALQRMSMSPMLPRLSRQARV